MTLLFFIVFFLICVLFLGFVLRFFGFLFVTVFSMFGVCLVGFISFSFFCFVLCVRVFFVIYVGLLLFAICFLLFLGCSCFMCFQENACSSVIPSYSSKALNIFLNWSFDELTCS